MISIFNREHGNLPDEILSDILSRLDAKVICRCKCVSKQWLNIIKDPYFVNMHRVRSMRNSPFLVQTRLDYYTRRKMQYCRRKTSLHICKTDKNGRPLGDFEKILDDFGVDKMVSSGNLICVENGCQIYVCNPSMHQLLRLPRHGGSHRPGWTSIGIGHLPVANAYKVAVFYYDVINHDFKLKCEILTITDRYKRDLAFSSSWRNIEVCIDQIFRLQATSVCVNEALYWIVTDPEWAILKFELENEKFDLLHYPPINCSNLEYKLRLDCVAEIKGKICLINGVIFSEEDGYVNSMDVWMLNDPPGNVWERKYRIDSSRFDKYSPWPIYTFLWQRDGEVWLYSNDTPSVLYYNLENKTFQVVEAFGQDESISHSCVYFDGLFSLGADKSEDLIRF